MANTTAVYARIDTKLKENAEEILAQLGITPTSAIQMFYSQVVLKQGLPFQPTLPKYGVPDITHMSRDELANEINKGIISYKNARTYSQEEVSAMIENGFE